MNDLLLQKADCEPMDVEDAGLVRKCRLTRNHSVQYKTICAREERNASIKKVSTILQKAEEERTLEETQMLSQCSETVEEVRNRWKRRDEAKRRLEEFEEPEEMLRSKCEILARAIAQSQHLVVYTGAGISTAARIPDYRGTNGIWTRLQQGKDIGNHDLSQAEPTYTHMALSQLYRLNILKYVVSQNCDGLHLRSGLPRTALSELHGNMYIEVCKNCKPIKEYWRRFDVTENTARYSHKTMRKCYECNGPLVDTIVHFGERGSLPWPVNWSGACKNARKATTIVCLGSSLKVLKKYPWLWQMDKPAKKRPNLYIVNLQWTPKDDCANVKLNGKCDKVMEIVMKLLGLEVPVYKRENDPIFQHATELCELEWHTTSQPLLKAGLDAKNQDCFNRTDLKRSICDTISNTTEKQPHCLPQGNSPIKCSNFSIDKILEKDPPKPPQFTFHNYQNFLAYYKFDLFYYPYQTSYMYPGLHNIINLKSEAASNPNLLHKCSFCWKGYNSSECLFYSKVEPVFANQQLRYSKMECVNKPNVCVCCDYTTDEDDEASDTNETAEDDKEQKMKVQPGWFGKGCRKNKKAKRK